MVWLDVSDEPWVFSIPDMGDRFYIMPMLSGLQRGVLRGRLAGHGRQCAGVRHHRAGVVGHVARGRDARRVAHRAGVDPRTRLLRGHAEGLQGSPRAPGPLLVRPAQRLRQPYTPPPGVVDETFDMEKDVRKQVNDLPLDEFFSYLAQLLKTNPPKPEDAPIVARMAEIGIVPGQEFDRQRAAEAGTQARSEAGAAGVGPRHEDQGARQRLALLDEQRRPVRNGLRTAGDGHPDRPGTQLPAGCDVPVLGEGHRRRPYDGSKHAYVMHFEKGQCRRSRASGR